MVQRYIKYFAVANFCDENFYFSHKNSTFADMKRGIGFFSLLRLVWQARRPSLVQDMPALPGGFWMRRGYTAMTFFGTIITQNAKEAETINTRLTALKNHEMIHLRQAQSVGDSWWRF